MDADKNLSVDDMAEVMEDNLLPSGSRIIDERKNKQVYPRPKKIIKGNIAEELGYADDDEE